MQRAVIVLCLGAAFISAAFWFVSAQTQEDVDRINKWFEQNKPKEWNPKIGEIQKPGEIQQPKGIQAIKVEGATCERRFTVGADVLFAFDKWTLTPDAEETLVALGPILQKEGRHPARIEGHTDAIGSDEYNQRLSAQRAHAVQEWLVAHMYLPASTAIQGYGKKRPVAPNTNADGSDNPAGRQKNRRVEVVLDTCR
jgi:outer membrane protein OmpA-like peptidoglycan-associated protein